MRIKLISLALMLAFSVLACKEDARRDIGNPTETTQQDPALQQVTPAATNPTGNVNPPHGQPGHRCDIAVGAPLDSAPATQNAATNMPEQSTTSPISVETQPAAGGDNTTTTAGTNPPHGQPGHRCDIAVGAPLPK